MRSLSKDLSPGALVALASASALCAGAGGASLAALCRRSLAAGGIVPAILAAAGLIALLAGAGLASRAVASSLRRSAKRAFDAATSLLEASEPVRKPEAEPVVASPGSAPSMIWREDCGALIDASRRAAGDSARLARLSACIERETELDLATSKERDATTREMGRVVGRSLAEVERSLDSARGAAARLREAAAGSAGVSREVGTALAEMDRGISGVAAAMDEFGGSAREIGDQAKRTSDISDSSVEGMKRTARSVEALRDSAQRIGEIVAMIDDIASQTNLLALNAAIEAAHAGAAGAGFAVVAAAVKGLAGKTSRATAEIQGQIAEVQRLAEAAVASQRSSAETIGSLDQVIDSLAAAVGQQEAMIGAVRDRARDLSAAHARVNGTMAVLASGVAATEEIAAGLNRVAAEIGESGRGLKADVEGFLERIARKTTQDAKSLTIQAAEFLARNGLEKSEAEFLREGDFRFGDIYVCVVDRAGRWVVYPPKPENRGKSIADIVDPDGVRIGETILATAAEGEGWTRYKWQNPATGRVQVKHTYVKDVAGTPYIVYVGVYEY